MSDLAIVAIPAQDDYVWKVSSEKVPHLTLMVLGDSDNPALPQIEEFLAHVAKTSMYRFGLDVDRRGTLGDKDADVLFFKNPGFNIKNLETVRRYLLTNQSIFTAYHSTDQFEMWTPHLTLGYPETPAKPLDRDYPISWVQFDRVALWMNDYDGPEFELKDQWDNDGMAMSGTSETELSHFGVKGMKWGQHKQHAQQAVGLVSGAKKLKKDQTKASAQEKVKAAGGLHKLTEKELQALNKRMELEKKYRGFMEEESKRRKEGAKTVAKILGEVGKVALPVVLSAAGAYAATRTANKHGGVYRTKAHVTRPVIDGFVKTTKLISK